MRIKIIVQFSGGKDSMASLLWVRNNISKDFITVFCDTGWESPITYDYIHDITEKLDLNLVTIRSKKYSSFVDLAKKKKRFPSTKARFCTEELKTKPMIDYILNEVNQSVLIVQGIRADESPARSLMQKQCTYFKYYTRPYGFDKRGKSKYHTYRKKEVLAFCEHFADDILRPIFNWTGQEVIDYIISNGFEPNPLYNKGFKRVGCFPCVMSNLIDIRSLIQYFPERITEIETIEKDLGHTLFPPDKIPKWASSNGKYPTIQDIKKYIEAKNGTGSLFEKEENYASCMSFYGLCE
jgi:3'-phosphoadenosine 5'-phosphosulfate sulfotransferase (PAPS reductase)/FAD synthetase